MIYDHNIKIYGNLNFNVNNKSFIKRKEIDRKSFKSENKDEEKKFKFIIFNYLNLN